MKLLAKSLTIFTVALALACGGNNEASESDVENAMEEVEDAMEDMAEEMEDDDANEREITIEELPEAVVTAINSLYEDYTIDEADEITNEDGSLSYEVELEKGEEEIEALFSANGDFLGIEEDDVDEEEDDNDHEGHDHD